ncbi:MAG: MATE family efflux transporter [Hyphomicrobiaceae bacterium]
MAIGSVDNEVGITRPVTHRAILTLAVPIILSNITTPLVGAVDTAVIGQLGVASLVGGVAIGATIFSLLFWTFGFLRLGTSGMTAQAFGRRDQPEIAATLQRALLVAVVAGAGLIALQWPIRLLVLWAIGGSPEVVDAAGAYFDVRIWSAPAAFVNFAILGWLVGLGRAGLAFLIELLLNVVNIALSVTLVLGMGWGVQGVAAATLVAEVVAALTGLVLARRELAATGGLAPWRIVLERRELWRVMAVNTDIMIRNFCLIAAFAFFTSQGARTDDITLAANAILFDIFGITAYFLDGFAHAAETFVGRSVGAREPDRLKEAVWLPTLWSGVLSLFAALATWLGGGLVVDLMTTNAEIRLVAREFLLWCALSPIAGFFAFQCDGIYIGATRTVDMRNMMILSLLLYLGAAWVLVPKLGNHGLWAALMIFLIARGVTLGWRLPALIAATARAPVAAT